MKRSFLALAAICAVFLAGCDSPKKTVETLRVEIKDFAAAPTETGELQIERNLAKLEKQVADLKARNSDDATDYQVQLSALRADYDSAKMNKALIDAKNAIQGIGNALKDGAKSVGDLFQGNSTNGN